MVLGNCVVENADIPQRACSDTVCPAYGLLHDAVLIVGQLIVVDLCIGRIRDLNAGPKPHTFASRVGSVIRARVVVNVGGVADLVQYARDLIVLQGVESIGNV